MTADAEAEPSQARMLDTTASIENLQTDEQRLVLDTVAGIRKCGLESILDLPQICVCGDQSSGKSSVLEALTEIPFPRADNLCTRFATEIILKREAQESLTIKVIPDNSRKNSQKDDTCQFDETITDFSQLPHLIEEAKTVMGLKSDDSEIKTRPFTRDVLSIEIAGPSRPQLTLVDLPGIIGSQTRGVEKEDIELVHKLTDDYIKQSRTICLVVIAGSNDYACQPILDKIRAHDPEGERSLGIITKPDIPPPRSGSREAFVELAQNKDVFFKLGWHVLKNREFQQSHFSLEERNASEADFFQNSEFKVLPRDCHGIDTLRERLSVVLFDHIKRELPKLSQDLTGLLYHAGQDLKQLGKSRGDKRECRDYLMHLSQDYHDVCKSAVEGHYESKYFNLSPGEISSFSADDSKAIRRLRAMVQRMNMDFADDLRNKGQTFRINMSEDSAPCNPPERAVEGVEKGEDSEVGYNQEGKDEEGDETFRTSVLQAGVPWSPPLDMSRSEAFAWVNQTLIQNRGRELQGNYNPLIIGELFKTQSRRWIHLAEVHLEQVAGVCRRFLSDLLMKLCPKEVHSRVWTSQIAESLQEKGTAASDELGKIEEDLQSYPINYNHYYTDMIQQARLKRMKKSLSASVEEATTYRQVDDFDVGKKAVFDPIHAAENCVRRIDPDMEHVTCEEVIDCLQAIYKVMRKTFLANITTQVVERHIVRGLDQIFSPTSVNRLSDEIVENLASEPATTKQQRDHLEDRIAKLQNGQKVLKGVMGSAGL
ncbi:MAG: hypothetical protein M1831_000640 [Alyxoria varia]|nr:MAG: hypothetical protein M1831_000640 [Alyxoria varia]